MASAATLTGDGTFDLGVLVDLTTGQLRTDLSAPNKLLVPLHLAQFDHGQRNAAGSAESHRRCPERVQPCGPLSSFGCWLDCASRHLQHRCR